LAWIKTLEEYEAADGLKPTYALRHIWQKNLVLHFPTSVRLPGASKSPVEEMHL
jgi:hypothetical protein